MYRRKEMSVCISIFRSLLQDRYIGSLIMSTLSGCISPPFTQEMAMICPATRHPTAGNVSKHPFQADNQLFHIGRICNNHSVIESVTYPRVKAIILWSQCICIHSKLTHLLDKEKQQKKQKHTGITSSLWRRTASNKMPAFPNAGHTHLYKLCDGVEQEMMLDTDHGW